MLLLPQELGELPAPPPPVRSPAAASEADAADEVADGTAGARTLSVAARSQSHLELVRCAARTRLGMTRQKTVNGRRCRRWSARRSAACVSCARNCSGSVHSKLAA